jgi:competence protein ComEA
MKTILLSRLFIVAWLTIGSPLFVPAAVDKGENDSSAPTAGSRSTTGNARKVDLNTADPATLEQLPGVGTEFANAIVAARPFKSVDDLARVAGFGPARIKALRGRVTASAVKPTATKPDASPVSATSKPPAVNEGKAISREAVTESYAGTHPGNPTAEKATSTATATRSETGGEPRVNLNTASKGELEALPEIGPVKAQAIIDARPFSAPEDIMRVAGIKAATYEAIKDRITVN